jgi:ubiquinone biosynthesis protein
MLVSRFRQIGRAVDHARRFRTIVHVFLKYGYDDLARRLPLPRVWLWLRTSRFRRKYAAVALLSRPERLRRAFEELGPAFVKLGQLLASRTQMLPAAYTEELEKLNDQVAPIPFAQIRSVIEAELRMPLAECYRFIDEKPLAAASIAQVHPATLLDGTDAVVKVQRPGIEAVVANDLEIMAHLAELLEGQLEEWKSRHPTAVVAEFKRRIEEELDFSSEISAMERFARQFEGDPTVRVPRVFPGLSSRRVLTMERVDGIPASQVERLDAEGIDRREVARRLGDLTLRQMFVHGFFHADPHAGNVHVLPGNVVCYLDFGMTGFLVLETRDILAALLVAVVRRDERAATRALLVLANAELDPTRPGLEADMADFIYRDLTGTGRDFVFLRFLQHLFRLTSRYDLSLPPEVFTVVKALGQVEHLVRVLDPDADFLEQARPFMRDIHAKRVSPRRMMREFLTFGGEAMTTLRCLPLEVRRMAAQFRDGKARVTFRLDGLNPLTGTLERVTNRLAFAVVLAALLVASALVIRSGVPPIWHGISLIGLAGYTFAGLMGGALLVSMIRHGRM